MIGDDLVAAVITASEESASWLHENVHALLEHAREVVPELLGGFIAYVLHLAYHQVWKRPGHFLMRILFRRK